MGLRVFIGFAVACRVDCLPASIVRTGNTRRAIGDGGGADCRADTTLGKTGSTAIAGRTAQAFAQTGQTEKSAGNTEKKAAHPQVCQSTRAHTGARADSKARGRGGAHAKQSGAASAAKPPGVGTGSQYAEDRTLYRSELSGQL